MYCGLNHSWWREVKHGCPNTWKFAVQQIVLLWRWAVIQISMEQVLLHDPDIIIESGDIPEASRLQWEQWRTLTSVRHQQVKYIAPDTIERQTLRSAGGVKLFVS